jgi:hypothetical protein
MAWGTLHTIDTLNSNFQTVAQFGEDAANEQLQAMLAAHRVEADNLFADLVEPTTDKQRRYGTTDQLTMVKTDEDGRPDAQKVSVGAVAGFPLELWTGSLGWTRKYIQTASVAEFADNVIAMMDADVQRRMLELKRALFTPTNYTFNDYLVDRLSQIPLQVRALLNADGLGIPAGPNGETFDGATHTHYLGTAAFAAADLQAALETVLEHYATGTAIIAIHRAQEIAVKAFAGFVGMVPARIVGATTANQYVAGNPLDTVQLYNRQLGEFNGAEVWVKPWAISGYVTVYMTGQPKPLCMRTRNPGSGGLVVVAEDERHPLYARTYEAEYGLGAWSRTAAAILDVNHATYTAPAIA